MPGASARSRASARSGAPAAAPSAQVFGTPDSAATRAALRFFKERRIQVHFVDISRRPMAPAELRRFIDRLGASAVADDTSRAWREAGLAYLRMDALELADRVLRDQRLLRQPLVRIGNAVAVGRDEAAWKAMLLTPATAAQPTNVMSP